MSQITPFDHVALVRKVASFTPEEIATVPDDKLERFKRMYDEMSEHEIAEQEAIAARQNVKACMKAGDEARAAKAKLFPPATFQSEWARTVRGRV